MKKLTYYIMQLTFNSQSQRKVTAGLGDFQIFRSYLLGVVATEWNGCDKGSPKAKILSRNYLMLLSSSVTDASCMPLFQQF